MQEENKAEPTTLTDLIIGTTLGAWYIFPDFDPSEAAKLIASMPVSLEQLTLVNASGACLVLPMRIVASVYNGDRSLSWKRP